MRQIGKLPQERHAQRLAAYLITLGVDAHAEFDGQEWIIWVRDENRLEEARRIFTDFCYDPESPKYEGAEQEADTIRRDSIQKRLDAQKNVIEMRGRWKSGRAPMPPTPLTATMIGLSILVTLLGGFGKAHKGLGGTVNEELSFVSRADYNASRPDLRDPTSLGNPLASVGKGELWRTVTPIFVHLATLHLVFNMIMFFQFGRLLEMLLGTARLAIMILVIAVVSNVAQAVMPGDLPGLPDSLGGNPFFGGMSGVVYGLFGYIWMRSIFVAQPGYHLNQISVIIMIGWLFLCMTPAIPNVANVAHVVGLVVGCAFEVIPAMLRR